MHWNYDLWGYNCGCTGSLFLVHSIRASYRQKSDIGLDTLHLREKITISGMINPDPSKFHYVPNSKTAGVISFIEIIGWNYLNPCSFDFKPISQIIPLSNSSRISPEFKRTVFGNQSR